jgi:hypothetical protein
MLAPMFRRASCAFIFSIVVPAGLLSAQVTVTATRIATSADDVLLTMPVALAISGGNIFVADAAEQALLVLDRSGSLVRRIGRRGRGPGEFMGLESVAVAGDTVYTLDSQARRITLFSTTGRMLATWGWSNESTPVRLYGTRSGALFAMGTVRPPTPDSRGVVPGMQAAQPDRRFFRVGAGGALTALPPLRDTTQHFWGANCETPDRVIHGIPAPFGDGGSGGALHAFLPSGDFVVGERWTRTLRWLNAEGRVLGQQRSTEPPPPMADSTWTRVLGPLAALRARHRTVTCTYEFVRPRTGPTTRAILTDDVGRTWVESWSAPAGTRFDVYDRARSLSLRVQGVRREGTVTPAVAGGLLAVIEKDADGVPRVALYRVPAGTSR